MPATDGHHPCRAAPCRPVPCRPRTGVFVGLRYNAPDLDGSSGSDQQRRRSGRWASLTLAAASSPFDGARIVDMRSEWQAGREGSRQGGRQGCGLTKAKRSTCTSADAAAAAANVDPCTMLSRPLPDSNCIPCTTQRIDSQDWAAACCLCAVLVLRLPTPQAPALR
jgi:hypothetical protein